MHIRNKIKVCGFTANYEDEYISNDIIKSSRFNLELLLFILNINYN